MLVEPPRFPTAASRGQTRSGTVNIHGTKANTNRLSSNKVVNYSHSVDINTLANPLQGTLLEFEKALSPSSHLACSSSISEDSRQLHRKVPPLNTKAEQLASSNFFEEKEKIQDYSDPVPTRKLACISPQGYPTSRASKTFLTPKSLSSPHLFRSQQQQLSPPPYSRCPSPLSLSAVNIDVSVPALMHSDSEDDRDENDIIYTSNLKAKTFPSSSRSGSSQSLRSRIFGLASLSRNTSSTRVRDKLISTTPGMVGAGETETETDEPSRHLPTARIVSTSGPLIPPNTLEERLTPLLFEFSRLLSIVPAIFGTLYNLYHIYSPPTYDSSIPNRRPPPERVDYLVSAIWAILTGYQCLSLATGLFTRWRLYYPPLSTLVRLLALQGICWPATHLTLTILEHEKRPVITWAVIGTTTCMSKSIQIWVTSNLMWWDRDKERERDERLANLNSVTSSVNGSGVPDEANAKPKQRIYWKRWRGGRRWDWREVGVRCVLPAGIVYFIMAWVEALRREFATC